ncbi:MAG: hypothetical protein ACOYL3_27125 [Desulfuromonadaceae bacterium]
MSLPPWKKDMNHILYIIIAAASFLIGYIAGLNTKPERPAQNQYWMPQKIDNWKPEGNKPPASG